MNAILDYLVIIGFVIFALCMLSFFVYLIVLIVSYVD